RDLTHRKGGARTAAVHPDHHAFEHLNAFLVALTDFDMHANGVARFDRRALHHVAALDGLYGTHLTLYLFDAIPSAAPRPRRPARRAPTCPDAAPASSPAPRAGAIGRSRRGVPRAAPAAPASPGTPRGACIAGNRATRGRR